MARNPLAPFRSGFGAGDPFMSLHREMNRLFDDVFRGAVAPSEGRETDFVPARMNVSETDNEIRIAAELPGVPSEEVEVTLDNDVVTIRGEKRFERKDEKENFHFVERSYGTFQRSLRLPFPVESDQISARFDNGVLTVTVPKGKAQERSRRIQVQSGGRTAVEVQDRTRRKEPGGKGSAGGKAA